MFSTWTSIFFSQKCKKNHFLPEGTPVKKVLNIAPVSFTQIAIHYKTFLPKQTRARHFEESSLSFSPNFVNLNVTEVVLHSNAS